MQQKLLGALFMAAGLGITVAIYLMPTDKLIWKNSEHYIVRYSLVIFLASGAMTSFVLGLLVSLGRIAPYNATESNRTNKAKIKVIKVVLGAPGFAALTVLLFSESESTLWKIRSLAAVRRG